MILKYVSKACDDDYFAICNISKAGEAISNESVNIKSKAYDAVGNESAKDAINSILKAKRN